MNLYKALRGLFPEAPLQVGEVIATDNGVATLLLYDGNRVQARGEASIGDHVYFRDNVIEGAAPDLPLEVIDI